MTISHKGIKIQFQESGVGKNIVFLHGFLENLTMWNSIKPHFKDYRCISIDLLGHGGSECLGYIHTMEQMAAAVLEVLEYLEVSNAVFVGHSMGGYVSLELAYKYPNMIKGLILLNSTSYADSEERKLSRDRAIEIVKNNPNAYTSMAIANLFAIENRKKYADQILAIKNQASNTPLQGIIAALEGMKVRKNLSNTLKYLAVPKAIFAGTQDPVLAYEQSVAESNYTNTELVTFEGGHMSYIENKSKFIKSLHSFLEHL
ncbi:alpha/beta fold hydrolase [Aquimarina brevivitae]|uniref:Pimeloyl-ACP methyl ester carboxylesterase n=1 Tax=Aquimarina brevivitae TaxID=323412 RepID=A0A4Q7PGB0_9FLAO|nr:alpha/beta hydrolase [Aquimarina brevivitae]RZS99563.1 pimeloyl-ACP methyl ester carboxylesterase [Aquimarina brevivitae]